MCSSDLAGFTAPFVQLDLRVGGRYLYCMRAPDGKDYWSTGVFREVVAPQRLVMTDSFSDEHGDVVSAAHYGMNAEFPLELMVTVTLEEQGGKTCLKLSHAGMPEGEDREMARAGWNESLDKLAAALKR